MAGSTTGVMCRKEEEGCEKKNDEFLADVYDTRLSELDFLENNLKLGAGVTLSINPGYYSQSHSLPI